MVKPSTVVQMRGSCRVETHLKHSHVGAVRGGGQVAAPRHRVVRRLHVQLAPQDAFIIELLLTQKHATETQSVFCHRQKRIKRGEFRFRTDPFADLSVDEDEVIQCQNYFCCSTSPTTETEASPSVSPGESDKRKHVSKFVLRVSLSSIDLLESEEEIGSNSSHGDQKKQKKQQRDRIHAFWKRRRKLVGLNTTRR